jgi:hypothetical protein
MEKKSEYRILKGKPVGGKTAGRLVGASEIIYNAPPYWHLRPFWLRYTFRHVLINGTIFGKKGTGHKICFDFLYTFYSKRFFLEEEFSEILS